MDETLEKIQTQLKAKHIAMLEVLKGLTIAEAKRVMEIVLEDISANAIIGDKNFV